MTAPFARGVRQLARFYHQSSDTLNEAQVRGFLSHPRNERPFARGSLTIAWTRVHPLASAGATVVAAPRSSLVAAERFYPPGRTVSTSQTVKSSVRRPASTPLGVDARIRRRLSETPRLRSSISRAASSARSHAPRSRRTTAWTSSSVRARSPPSARWSCDSTTASSRTSRSSKRSSTSSASGSRRSSAPAGGCGWSIEACPLRRRSGGRLRERSCRGRRHVDRNEEPLKSNRRAFRHDKS